MRQLLLLQVSHIEVMVVHGCAWLCMVGFGGVFFSAQPGYRQPGVFLERIEHLLLPHCRRDETMITIVCIQ